MAVRPSGFLGLGGELVATEGSGLAFTLLQRGLELTLNGFELAAQVGNSLLQVRDATVAFLARRAGRGGGFLTHTGEGLSHDSRPGKRGFVHFTVTMHARWSEVEQEIRKRSGPFRGNWPSETNCQTSSSHCPSSRYVRSL